MAILIFLIIISAKKENWIFKTFILFLLFQYSPDSHYNSRHSHPDPPHSCLIPCIPTLIPCIPTQFSTFFTFPPRFPSFPPTFPALLPRFPAFPPIFPAFPPPFPAFLSFHSPIPHSGFYRWPRFTKKKKFLIYTFQIKLDLIWKYKWNINRHYAIEKRVASWYIS